MVSVLKPSPQNLSYISVEGGRPEFGALEGGTHGAVPLTGSD